MQKWAFRAYNKITEKMIPDFLNFAGWEGGKGNNPWHDDNYIIQQGTGIKDKHGKEIYVGDIIYYIIRDDLFQRNPIYGTAQIVFESGCFILKNRKIASTDRNGWSFHDIENKEIFGNIYENPNLLKAIS